MPTIQQRLRVLAWLHPHLNQDARDLLNEAADALDQKMASPVRARMATRDQCDDNNRTL